LQEKLLVQETIYAAFVLDGSTNDIDQFPVEGYQGRCRRRNGEKRTSEKKNERIAYKNSISL